MSIYRIYAITARYAIVGFREMSRLMQITYFPFLDIALWGYMGLWMQKSSTNPHILMIYLAATVLWGAVWTAEIELSLNLLEELESRNIVNLASTPLTHSEWLISNIILATGKSFLVVLFSTGITYIIFGINIFSLGSAVIPIALSIICSGVILGIFLTGILLWGGQQITVLVWSIPYLVLTFSAPFYPADMLPGWLQPVVKALPTTHIFESLRTVINSGFLPQKTFLISLLLNALYLVVAISFNYRMFNRSKKRGLAQLEQE